MRRACPDKTVTSVQIGFVLAPRINAAGRMGAADMAADLLLCTDPRPGGAPGPGAVRPEPGAPGRGAGRSTPRPWNRSRSCRPRSAAPWYWPPTRWHQGVVGIVASRLSEKYSCPSFMIHLYGGTGKGSCRSWGGFNLFAALEACSDLLLGFGGHELAAGFTI